jgi:hypothetical protein
VVEPQGAPGRGLPRRRHAEPFGAAARLVPLGSSPSAPRVLSTAA